MENKVDKLGQGAGDCVLVSQGIRAGNSVLCGESFSAEKTMHGNLVYDMSEEEPTKDLLPDPEVYEAARRIDEERWFYRFVKRSFDIVFSALVLVLFCWLFAIIAIVIKIDGPSGPVIFSQKRVGKDGKCFKMYKFRTMVPDAESQLDDLLERNEKTGPVFKIASDPRILASGRWLRKLSLDELPQFWNVLKGNISQRIIKKGQGEPCEISGLFALPAKEMRTQNALFPQVKVAPAPACGQCKTFSRILPRDQCKLNDFFTKWEITQNFDRKGLRVLFNLALWSHRRGVSAWMVG